MPTPVEVNYPMAQNAWLAKVSVNQAVVMEELRELCNRTDLSTNHGEGRLDDEEGVKLAECSPWQEQTCLLGVAY
jgi:hypothetical protein